MAWGQDDRSVVIRVVGQGETLRVEHRFPGADANPYLAAAAIIAAGLEGIASRRDPGPPVEGNADAQHDLPRPPASLGEALAALESTGFVKSAFGSAVATHFAAHARAEREATLTEVTDWELRRGFETVYSLDQWFECRNADQQLALRRRRHGSLAVGQEPHRITSACARRLKRNSMRPVFGIGTGSPTVPEHMKTVHGSTYGD